ncbi:Protein of unknown function [Melghirimyces thermohalophilus]|uniref:Uncharacterized protein n=1 Tax=Melghirimyces thermohalophilus TaxID=1236220 RepID=A0A1G6RKW4_9BACL|nr:DUF4244 domain-containing protein [Melghirimyces thermohalophilus]SDD05272.1 Protein of unknown function [Melghirimyces thermohalophilus]
MKGRNIRWWNRRGSATLEYVVILAAGAILALALTHALTSDEVKGSLQKKVMAALLGQETETPDAPFPGSTDPGGAPDGPAGGSTERPVSSTRFGG